MQVLRRQRLEEHQRLTLLRFSFSSSSNGLRPLSPQRHGSLHSRPVLNSRAARDSLQDVGGTHPFAGTNIAIGELRITDVVVWCARCAISTGAQVSCLT
jgi:hypothetical protein